MARTRLTAKLLEAIRPPESGRTEYHDDLAPGLVLRVSSSGVMSWSYVYRFKDPLRRLTLGQYPGVSLALARERAADARAGIQRGEDPVQARKDAEKQTANAEREAQENGFRSCMTQFIEK